MQLVSTRFISAGTQLVETRQILPLRCPRPDDEPVERIDDRHRRSSGYTEFEPEPENLLAELAPRAAEAEIFAALLEASASFSPPSNGPWRPPPRTPTSSSAP